MRIRALISILAVAIAAALLPLAARMSAGVPSGQQSKPPVGDQQNPPTIRVQVSLVNLFATVRDGHKRIIPDLTKDDFKVFEDNQEQKIESFSRETALPITMGLLLDTSGSEQYMLGAEQEAASRFIHQVMRKTDEAMVISFDMDVDLLANWTSDPSVIDHGIRKAKINAASAGPMINPGPIPQHGPMGTNFYDAVVLACTEELAGEAGRKALVVLTDAMDNGSKYKLQDAIEAAQRADAVVYALIVYDPREGNAADIAKKLTDETGGRTIIVRSEKNLEAAFEELSEELRTQYLLAYYPTNPTHDGGFRKIKVEMANHDLHVLTRKGYYAPKQ